MVGVSICNPCSYSTNLAEPKELDEQEIETMIRREKAKKDVQEGKELLYEHDRKQFQKTLFERQVENIVKEPDRKSALLSQIDFKVCSLAFLRVNFQSTAAAAMQELLPRLSS